MTHEPEDADLSQRGADLDPDIRRFVQETSARWRQHPSLDSVSLAEARRIAEIVRAPWVQGGPQMASIEERRIDVPSRQAVRVRIYDPGPPSSKPAVVYLHGGGWTIFSVNTHDRVMREYAARAGMVVVGVDYSLSPEAKYPVALDEVCAVVRFIAESRARPFIDSAGIALAGDSAGANLSLAAALRLRDEGRGSLVDALVLNYGVFERGTSETAWRRFGGEGYMLSGEEMEWFWGNYLRDPRDAEDPYVCPMLADLRDLPPALLVVPECDLLTEQSLRMAERLREAGVAAELKRYAGATHSFLEAVSISVLADRALADTAAWLRATLAQRGKVGKS